MPKTKTNQTPFNLPPFGTPVQVRDNPSEPWIDAEFVAYDPDHPSYPYLVTEDTVHSYMEVTRWKHLKY